ncbi:hypothetical protein [Bradyrhizobium septentrionale]|uniref:Uncharacterized protein n=1 Tax=Bradyrhizobium septentrionale TaxID=1404411 RepID=A0A973ZZ40_9BRAD|nr:hypothetical protein [Bradyrhizobium septentrionale]UGY19666.1 hypothetical protein HAP48_0020745 [Bradyrhizobium septentrionale]UGY28454.1 hypothetical protein HU675_0017755 [Bradyrhizobium septentrionale]
MSSLIVLIAIPVVAVALLSGRFTANSAVERGRSRRAWFVWGALLFPLFPIPWMVPALLPNK